MSFKPEFLDFPFFKESVGLFGFPSLPVFKVGFPGPTGGLVIPAGSEEGGVGGAGGESEGSSGSP